MAGAMTDGTGGSRDLSMRVRMALFAVALAAAPLAACQQDATLDQFTGPSELGLSLTLSASPDVLPVDGASQSLVSILARDGAGQVLANVTVRLQLRVGGVLQDYGQLSARTLVTGQDGRALATYTAPLDPSGVDTQTQVDILVTPVGDNYANALPRSLTIRLVPGGLVIPPFSLTAGFRVTPSNPTQFQEILFEITCLAETDPNCVRGPVATYAWDFGDGSTASGPTVTHAYSSPLTYTVTLTLTDAFDRSTSATQSVTVGGGPTPTAAFVFSPSAPTTTTEVQFNATSSTAPAGRTITGYAWNFGDGVTKTGATTTNSFSVAGVYGVTLTVTDSMGATDTSSTSITVTDIGAFTPTASFVFSPTAPPTPTTVQFNAAASTSPAGTITGYAWNFGDGATGTGATTTHLFTTAGVYTVVLTVTDSAGATGTTNQTVTVVGGTSTLPTASFTASPSPTPSGASTVVDATASTPSNGATIVSYTWNFGDSAAVITCPVPGPGPAGCGPTPPLASHMYMADATYTITLTVTDSAGLTGTTTRSLTVSP